MATRYSELKIFQKIQLLYEEGEKKYIAQDDLNAISNYEQALDQIQSLPKKDTDLELQYKINLRITDIYIRHGEWSQATKFRQHALYMANRMKNQVYIADCIDRQGDIKRMTGDESGALSDFRISLDMKLKSLDGDNLSIGDTYHKIGRAYFSQKEYNKALLMYQKALDIRIRKLGDDDLIVAQSYHNIGLAYSNLGMLDDAINMNKKSLEINLAKLDNDHYHVTTSYDFMGNLYKKKGAYKEALAVFRKSLEIRLQRLGSNDVSVASSYRNIGLLHRSAKQNNQAIRMLEKAIEILTFNYGENHRNIANIYNEVATCYSHLHQKDVAANIRRKADSIRKILSHSPQKNSHRVFQPLSHVSRQSEGHENGQSVFQQIETRRDRKSSDHGTGIQSKNYLKAYNRAIKQGKRRNNLIRAMFVGPRNVGKSSIMRVFTQQRLSGHDSPTQVAEWSERMIKINAYDIYDGKFCAMSEILEKNVIASIEESPQVTKELDDNPNFKKQIIETPILSKDNAQAATNKSSLNNLCLDSSDTTQSDNLIVSISSQVTKISLESENSSTMQNDLQDYFVSITKDNEDAKEDRKYAKIWDFGGHSVYHVTHRPFMSANSIYILVFNITQNINDEVKTRDGLLLTTNYLQAMQEWLTSIISGHRDQSDININIDGVPVKYSLPIVILVASHGDSLHGKEDGNRRFKQFEQDLISYMPTYKRNIYSSGIIFNCKPEDNNLATISQRQECCHRLHLIIKEFVLSLPFIRNPIPIRWYIMATILNTSFHRYENQESSSVINQIRAARVRDIMTMQDVTLLAHNSMLYESEEELKAMLMYLHDLGEIIFCQKAGDNGIIITNVDRLLDIFRAIIQLDECLCGSLELKSEYKKASQTGRLSRVYIEYSLEKFKLDENSKNWILNLMETYDIICSIRNDNIENREDSQYFVPYLLRPDVKPFDLSRFHKSDWLYIGYSYKEVPHIPDGIYYCLLSSCLREWNNTKVEICYQCAKFYLKEDHYYLIVKIERSHIGLQYCYQKMADAKTDQMFKSKIRDCIREKRPHDIVLKKLSSIVAERMPKFYNATCYFHVRCPKCDEFTKTTSKCNLEGNKMTECEYCNEIFSSQSAKDWKIDEEEPEISVSKEVDPKEVDIRRYFSYIASLIETDWKKLAAVLDPTISTKVIQEQNRNDVFGQAIELLNKWYNKHPTVGIRHLEVALTGIGRSDIVTCINQINPELNI